MLVKVEPRYEKEEQGERDPEQVELRRVGIDAPSQFERRSLHFGIARALGEGRRSRANRVVVARLERLDQAFELGVVGKRAGEFGHAPLRQGLACARALPQAAFSSGFGAGVSGRTPISSSKRVFRSTCHAAFSES